MAIMIFLVVTDQRGDHEAFLKTISINESLLQGY